MRRDQDEGASLELDQPITYECLDLEEGWGLNNQNIQIMRYDFKAEFFKTLAHPLRIQILDELRAGPISVGELRERLGVEQSTLSQQLAVLRVRSLVRARRAGRTIRYEISDGAIWQVLDSARVIFDNQLVSTRSILEDLAREDARDANRQQSSRPRRPLRKGARRSKLA